MDRPSSPGGTASWPMQPTAAPSQLRLGRMLGSGAQAAVHLAHLTLPVGSGGGTMEVQCAVKVLLPAFTEPSQSGRGDLHAMFLQEAVVLHARPHR